MRASWLALLIAIAVLVSGAHVSASSPAYASDLEQISPARAVAPTTARRLEVDPLDVVPPIAHVQFVAAVASPATRSVSTVSAHPADLRSAAAPRGPPRSIVVR